MSDVNNISKQQEDQAIWEGIGRLSALPAWLMATRDPEQISAALLRRIPEFASGALRLEGCKMGHIRLKDSVWTSLLEIGVARPGEETRQIALKGTIVPPGVRPLTQTGENRPFLSDGWQVSIPELNLELTLDEPDRVLSSLDFLTVPEQALPFLNEHIRSGSTAYRDIRIQSCRPRVVRYNPGSRCTILYDLDYEDGAAQEAGWPDLVVAKTYKRDKGQNAYDSMRALWDSPLGSSPTLTIAEPMAYVPEKRVLIQGPIREERTLKELEVAAIQTGSEEALQALREAMCQTARGLAELHRSGVGIGRAWVWPNEREDVRDQADRLGEAVPQVASALAPLLARLTSMADRTPADPSGPTHGSFRPAQVLLYRGQIGFIDFDSFCQAEPSMDLALFLGTFLTIGMTALAETIHQTGATHPAGWTYATLYPLLLQIRAEFLDEYSRLAPFTRSRLILWETLDLLMSVLHCWIKVKIGDLEPNIVLLKQHLLANGVIS